MRRCRIFLGRNGSWRRSVDASEGVQYREASRNLRDAKQFEGTVLQCERGVGCWVRLE
jgi:hypothetical protein